MTNFGCKPMVLSSPALQVEAFGAERVREGMMRPPSGSKVLDFHVLLDSVSESAELYLPTPSEPVIASFDFDEREYDPNLPLSKLAGLKAGRERVHRTGWTLESLRAGKYAVSEAIVVVPWKAYVEKTYTPIKGGDTCSVVKPASYVELQEGRHTMLMLRSKKS